MAVVKIPSLSKVRLVFDVGFGLQILVAMPSKMANQCVMLSGEGGPYLGCPNVLTLPASSNQLAYITTMTVKQFITKVTKKVTAYNYSLLAHSNVSDTTKILQIAPVPTFLVSNGFEKDIYAAEVLKVVLSMDRDSDRQEMILHLQ